MCYDIFEDAFSFPHETSYDQFALVVYDRYQRRILLHSRQTLDVSDVSDVLDMNHFYLCGLTKAGLVHLARPPAVTGVIYICTETIRM